MIEKRADSNALFRIIPAPLSSSATPPLIYLSRMNRMNSLPEEPVWDWGNFNRVMFDDLQPHKFYYAHLSSNEGLNYFFLAFITEKQGSIVSFLNLCFFKEDLNTWSDLANYGNFRIDSSRTDTDAPPEPPWVRIYFYIPHVHLLPGPVPNNIPAPLSSSTKPQTTSSRKNRRRGNSSRRNSNSRRGSSRKQTRRL
jgi:hypothetical protein